MRMQGFGWAFIACFFGLALIVVAAEPNARSGRETTTPQAQQPKPALPVRVTVTKTDGKVLAGTMTAADHDGISLTYGPKSENLHFAWSEVKSISNGLTRE